MKVLLRTTQNISGTVYDPWDVVDIDADSAVGLIDRGDAAYLGGGTRHATVWTDLVQAAVGINPVGAIADPALDSTEAGWPGTLLFSGSADNMIAGQWQLIHEWKEGSAVYPHIHWMLTSNSSNAVVWEFYYRISGVGAAAGAWVGPVSGTLAISHGNVADAHAITTFGSIPMTGNTVSAIIAWRLYRRGNTDANNDTARLLSIDAHFAKDSTGSLREFQKEMP